MGDAKDLLEGLAWDERTDNVEGLPVAVNEDEMSVADFGLLSIAAVFAQEHAAWFVLWHKEFERVAGQCHALAVAL